jgi:hypothetical protein
MISAVLEEELAAHPDLLDRVLLALINARPDQFVKRLDAAS